MPMLAMGLSQKATTVVELFEGTTTMNEANGDVQRPITLLDVFKVVDQKNYPFLRVVVLNVVSIMATVLVNKDSSPPQQNAREHGSRNDIQLRVK